MSTAKRAPLSDEGLALLEEARGGDLQALEDLMRGTCVACLRHVCRNYEMFTFDELYHEVFLKLSAGECAPLRTLQNPQAFPFFAMRTGINLCLQGTRGKVRTVFMEAKDLVRFEDKRGRTGEQEVKLSEVLRAISELKDERQRLILLAALEGTEMEETAHALNIKRGYGDVLKNRGIELLRQKLNERKGVPIA